MCAWIVFLKLIGTELEELSIFPMSGPYYFDQFASKRQPKMKLILRHILFFGENESLLAVGLRAFDDELGVSLSFKTGPNVIRHFYNRNL